MKNDSAAMALTSLSTRETDRGAQGATRWNKTGGGTMLESRASGLKMKKGVHRRRVKTAKKLISPKQLKRRQRALDVSCGRKSSREGVNLR